MYQRLDNAFNSILGIIPSNLFGYTKTPVSPRDFRAAAENRVPKFLWRYLEGASGDRATFQRNEEALREIYINPRILKGVSEVSTSVEIMGHTWSMPVGMAPVGLAGMYARRGEVQGARAAKNLNVPFCLSTVGVCTLGEVVKESENLPWFQLYVIRDTKCREELLQEAKHQGCDTLVFTVDMPVPGKRYDDKRPGGLAYGTGMLGKFLQVAQAITHPNWGINVGLLGRPHGLGNIAPFLSGKKPKRGEYFKWMKDNFDPSIKWKILESIRNDWNGKLVVKGIMDATDACEAQKYGVDGIVVSNHGGRQIEGSPGTADVLPRIARAVKEQNNKTAVLVDGGVRTGTDVLRMLALGADGILVGRPWIYALTAEGQVGIERWFKLVKEELEVQMTLAGVGSVEDISSRNLVDPRVLGFGNLGLG